MQVTTLQNNLRRTGKKNIYKVKNNLWLFYTASLHRIIELNRVATGRNAAEVNPRTVHS